MPAAAPRTLIVVPTYNERENAPALADQLLRLVPKADLLFIDDNSPDGTGQWCATAARREPRLRCVQRPGKLGLGSATIEGMRRAIADGYDLVLTMDADFSHPPEFAAQLIDAMRDPAVDVAIGSRYVAGGGVRGWPWWRRLASRAVNRYARSLLRLSVRDCSGAFRCYRTATLARMRPERVQARGYAYLEEILWRLRRGGARFREIPIVFVNRRQGRSKINLREALAALWIIFRLGLRERLQRRSADSGE